MPKASASQLIEQRSQMDSRTLHAMTVLFSEIVGFLSLNAAPLQIPLRITPRWWVVSSLEPDVELAGAINSTLS